MTWIEAIILGLVQGLTEFLPISSSAHIRIVGEFLPSATDPGAAFTAITQLGTELAVLIYFWRDITRIIGRWCAAVTGRIPHSDPDARMGWLIIVGSIPIAVLGLLLADRLGRQTKPLEKLTVRDGVLYGLAQALALIPGVSRSGGTIAAGLAMGYTRPAATRYAFLLAVPAVFASGLYKLYTSLTDPGTQGPYGMGETLVATAIAFVVAYAVIAWLMRFISTNSYLPFVWYRILLGGVLFALLGAGVISA